MKNIFVVLNPPRCGSSCLARGLQTLGIDLGTDLMKAAPANPKGFFEDNALNNINAQLTEYYKKKLLEKDNSEIDHIDSEIFKSACDILRKRTENTENFGFKDPRTIRYLPFWQKVFEELKLNDHYVIAIRNPACFVQSMARRAYFERSLLVWVDHLLPTCDYTQNKKRIVVDYDELLSSPRKQLERISETFGIMHLHNEDEIQKYCYEFLDTSLQHHTATIEDLKKSEIFFPICFPLYSFLLKLAKDELQFDSPEYENEWQKIKSNMQENRILYRYIELFLAKNEDFDNKLKSLAEHYEKTISWRMTAPFRNIKERFIMGFKHANSKLQEAKQMKVS